VEAVSGASLDHKPVVALDAAVVECQDEAAVAPRIAGPALKVEGVRDAVQALQLQRRQPLAIWLSIRLSIQPPARSSAPSAAAPAAPPYPRPVLEQDGAGQRVRLRVEFPQPQHLRRGDGVQGLWV
jgi:hypothetical protein